MDVLEAIGRHHTTEVLDAKSRSALLLPDGGLVDMAYHHWNWVRGH
jgi:hypothetical protein